MHRSADDPQRFEEFYESKLGYLPGDATIRRSCDLDKYAMNRRFQGNDTETTPSPRKGVKISSPRDPNGYIVRDT